MRRIAESTVRRLSLYLRFLEEFEQKGTRTVSSEALATRSGGDTTPAQVRKDLSFFGSFGKRGLGYDVRALATRLREILGLKRGYRVALLGAGKVGSALVQYEGFRERGFEIVAIYDHDPKKIGARWGGLTVRDVAALEGDMRRDPVDIAIVVTPAPAAQGVVDRLVRCGVRGILNFAPTPITVPSSVVLKTVNMAQELEALSFALAQK